MKYVVSRYNQDVSWLPEYTDDFYVYDRSEDALPGEWVEVVPNLGSDIADKLKFIIDNYDDLPEVTLFTKANLFKFITPEEFEAVKDNKTFTPLLTRNHASTFIDLSDIRPETVAPHVRRFLKAPWRRPYSYYSPDGMYHELNVMGFANTHPFRTPDSGLELAVLMGIAHLDYVPFAPGSNYIVPRKNILKHPKSFYEEIRNHLIWDRYPGEAMVAERGLYTILKD